jgi:Dipeptidyl aminopeptidases/acylaminoacyl-peptidases
MAHRLASLAAIFLLGAVSKSTAPDVQHVSVAGRDVAVWKPLRTLPPNGYPLTVFSNGFTGCNTQTKFLMQALAKAGYWVLAPNHKDAGC